MTLSDARSWAVSQPLLRPVLGFARSSWRALDRFNVTDGWAIASHVAMTALMAMFPFLIFLTAFASFLDLSDLAQTGVDLIFEAWPPSVAGPIAGEVRSVLTVRRGDLLTIGILLALYFSSNGVEALRVGLNRAYGVAEHRSYLWLRLQSAGFVLLGSLVLLTLALLVVVGPVMWTTVQHEIALDQLSGLADRSGLSATAPYSFVMSQLGTLVRYSITVVVMAVALFVAHLWLPAGRRKVREVAPGVVLTIVAWILGAVGFGTYLANFGTYASTYAGLAGVMTALVFLYLLAAILLFGASLNAARIEYRLSKKLAEQMDE